MQIPHLFGKPPVSSSARAECSVPFPVALQVSDNQIPRQARGRRWAAYVAKTPSHQTFGASTRAPERRSGHRLSYNGASDGFQL